VCYPGRGAHCQPARAVDDADLLGQRDEFGRRDTAEGLRVPTHQQLTANGLSALIDLLLHDEGESAVFGVRAQLLLQVQPALPTLVEIALVDHRAVTALFLGGVHRHVGAPTLAEVAQRDDRAAAVGRSRLLHRCHRQLDMPPVAGALEQPLDTPGLALRGHVLDRAGDGLRAPLRVVRQRPAADAQPTCTVLQPGAESGIDVVAGLPQVQAEGQLHDLLIFGLYQLQQVGHGLRLAAVQGVEHLQVVDGETVARDIPRPNAFAAGPQRQLQPALGFT